MTDKKLNQNEISEMLSIAYQDEYNEKPKEKKKLKREKELKELEELEILSQILED